MGIGIVSSDRTNAGGRRKRVPDATRSGAFTLVELLVVVFIIGLLMALLLPTLNAARERGRRAVCLANLHSLGQVITLYASENQERLVPGDSPLSSAVWGSPTDTLDGDDAQAGARAVNLGHLLQARLLPVPTNRKTVIFCPSTRLVYNFTPPGDLPQYWGANATAYITYAYNEALDGFGHDVIKSKKFRLAHKDTVNFVCADGSARAFRFHPAVFDKDRGPEDFEDVIARYAVCFPTSMVFSWLEHNAIDEVAAQEFLMDPVQWYVRNSPLTPHKRLRLADVASKPLICDLIGQTIVKQDSSVSTVSTSSG